MTAYETYGYQAVVELGASAVNRLFDGQVFERSRVNPLRNEPNDDPQAPTSRDFISIPFGLANLYVSFGAPEVLFPARVGTTAGLRLPLARLAFEPAIARDPIATNTGRLALELGNVQFSSTGNRLEVDLSAIGANDVRYAFRPDPSQGWKTSSTDAEFAAVLMQLGITVPELGLGLARAQIARLVNERVGRVSTAVALPLAGGSDFDVVLFGGAEGCLQLRIPARGGDRAAGGTPLRHAGQHYAIVVARAVLEDRIAATIESRFPSQQASFDIAVPPGTNTVMPFGPGTARPAPIAGLIFSAPGDQSKLRFPAGTFERRTRGKLHNWSRGTESDFEVPDANPFEISIAASSGERVGLTLERLGLSEGKLNHGRPSFELDGEEGVVFHADLDYFLTDAPLAFDLTVRVALDPDPLQRFGVQARQASIDVKGPTAIAAYVLGTLFGVSVVAKWSLFDAFYIHPLATERIRPLLDLITHAFAFEPPEQLALYLDELHVTDAGLYLGGSADAGLLERSGRSIPIAGHLAIPTGPPNLPGTPVFLTWDHLAEPFRVRCSAPAASVPTSDAPSRFWSATPDASPDPTHFALQTVTLPAGTSVLTFVRSVETSLVKLLLDRPGASAPPLLHPLLLWVVYPRRPDPAIALTNNVVPQVVHNHSTLLLTVTELRHEGTISLDRTRIYLTNGTVARGREKWSWNGQPLDATEHVFHWGAIRLDPNARAIYLRVEAGVPDAPVQHLFEVEVEDVFGQVRSARLRVETINRMLSPRPIALNYPWFRDPRWPLVEPFALIRQALAGGLRLARSGLLSGVQALDRLGLVLERSRRL